MALFDRYNTPLDYISFSYSETDDAYCNPSDFFVTELECQKYVKLLKQAREQCLKWNKKRRRVFLSLLIASAVLLFACFIMLLYSFTSSSVFLISLNFIIPMLWGVVNLIDRIHKSFPYKIRKDFYPSINDNVEMLFSYYLWKKQLLEKANNVKKEESQRIITWVKLHSHPYIEEFEQIIKSDFYTPSGDFAIGDVKFGMTSDEILKTKIFRGVNINDNYLSIGYLRNKIIGDIYNLPGSFTSFIMEKDKLSRIEIKYQYQDNYDFNAYHLRHFFVDYCKELHRIYGNPINLIHKPYSKTELEISPYQTAEFSIGQKLVTFKLQKRKEVVLTYEPIYKTDLSIQNKAITAFNENWFGRLLSENYTFSEF